MCAEGAPLPALTAAGDTEGFTQRTHMGHEGRANGVAHSTQSSYTHALPCVCDPHTLCAGSHALPGGLLSLREALLGPNRAWEHCPWQGQARHTLCSVCEARTHVCAGLHTTLGGHLSFREALLGPNRAWDTCP